MYRDDPLPDEEELRAVLGDRAVDVLLAAGRDDAVESPAEVALDVLRVLQGWVDDDAAGSWFHTAQQRLGGVTPVEALAGGSAEDVRAAARRWAAAQS